MLAFVVHFHIYMYSMFAVVHMVCVDNTLCYRHNDCSCTFLCFMLFHGSSFWSCCRCFSKITSLKGLPTLFPPLFIIRLSSYLILLILNYGALGSGDQILIATGIMGHIMEVTTMVGMDMPCRLMKIQACMLLQLPFLVLLKRGMGISKIMHSELAWMPYNVAHKIKVGLV